MSGEYEITDALASFPPEVAVIFEHEVGLWTGRMAASTVHGTIEQELEREVSRRIVADDPTTIIWVALLRSHQLKLAAERLLNDNPGDYDDE